MQHRRATGAITLGLALVTVACGASSDDLTATDSDRLPSVAGEPVAADEPVAPPRVSLPEYEELLDRDLFDRAVIDPNLIEVLSSDTIDLPLRDTSLLDENVSIELVPSYGTVMRFEAAGIENGETISHTVEFIGIIDRVNGIGELSVAAEQLAIFDDRVEIHPDVDEVVWVQSATDDDQFAYGLLDEDEPAGTPSWSRVSNYGAEYTPVFFNDGGLTLDSLGDLLYDDPASWEREDLGDGRFATRVEYLADETLSHADDSIVDVAPGSSGPVRMHIEHDERGVVDVLVIEADYDPAVAEDGGPLSIRLQVDYTYPGDVESIREPVGVDTSPPPIDPTTSVDPRRYEERDAIALLPEIELKIIGAWERENHEMLVSVRRDGRVTIVTDRSVVSSTRDFRSLWLTEQGRQRLSDELIATGAFDQAGPQSGGRVGPDLAYAELTIQGSQKFSLGDYHPDQPDRPGTDEPGRVEAEAAVALLTDLSWLDDSDIATPIGPWVPDSMWVSARQGVADRSGLPDPTEIAVWPYESTIEEMSTSAGRSVYDEPTLDMCLEGDDVAPLFALLTGVNHAYLRIDNGGEIWELNVQPSIPGSGSNRC